MRLVVQRRRLSITAGLVREEVWTSSPPAAPPTVPPASTTPVTTSRVVVTGVKQTSTTPYFRYYATDPSTLKPTLRLTTPLSTVDLSRVALVDVSFTAQGKRSDVVTTFTNQILNRSTTCIV